MKKIKYIVFTLLLLVPVISLNAQSVNKDDIPNATYVIGTHMFTREVNTETGYNGQLTTQLIMLAARTIQGNTLEDMIIYYKNPRGNWVNAMTGEAITPTTTLMINYENKASKIAYGDINEDGVVDDNDWDLLIKYLNDSTELTPQGKVNADLNNDGEVNKIDNDLLYHYLSGTFGTNFDLPNEPLSGKVVSVEFVVDNEKYAKYYTLENYRIMPLESIPQKLGYIFEGWFIDGTDNEYDDEQNITSNLIVKARFRQNLYTIDVTPVDEFSPDRILTVKLNGEEIDFKQINYTDGVKLCSGTNPTVSYVDLKNERNFKVILTDDTIVDAIIGELNELSINPKFEMYGNEQNNFFNLQFKTYDLPAGIINVELLKNNEMYNTYIYEKKSYYSSPKVIGCMGSSIYGYSNDNEDVINISYKEPSKLTHNDIYQIHIVYSDDNGVSREYYSRIYNESEKTIYNNAYVKISNDYLDRNLMLPSIYQFTLNNETYYMAYKYYTNNVSDDYEIYDVNGNRDDILFSIPAISEYDSIYGITYNNTDSQVMDRDYLLLRDKYNNRVQIEFHDTYLLALNSENNQYTITKYTLNNGKVIMGEINYINKEDISWWK